LLPRLTGRRDRSPRADMKAAASVLPASLSMLTRKLKSATGFAFSHFSSTARGTKLQPSRLLKHLAARAR